MPLEVICSNCGATLYKSMTIKPLTEIIEQYNNKCPYCGKDLNFDYRNIEIERVQKNKFRRS